MHSSTPPPSAAPSLPSPPSPSPWYTGDAPQAVVYVGVEKMNLTAAVAHGVSLWLGLGLLLGVGMLLGRYSDSGRNKSVLHALWVVQVSSLLLATTGMVVAGVWLWDPQELSLHCILGTATFVCFLLQNFMNFFIHFCCSSQQGFWPSAHRLLRALVFLAAAASVVTGVVDFGTSTHSSLLVVVVLCALHTGWTAALLLLVACVQPKAAFEMLTISEMTQKHEEQQRQEIDSGTAELDIGVKGATGPLEMADVPDADCISIDFENEDRTSRSGSDFFELSLESPMHFTLQQQQQQQQQNRQQQQQ